MMMLRLSNRSTKKPIGKPAASYQSIVKIGGAVMLLLVPLLSNVRVLFHLNSEKSTFNEHNNDIIRIAHVANFYHVPYCDELFCPIDQAQSVTFASVIRALQATKATKVDATAYAAIFEGDENIVPDGIITLDKRLTRSTASVYPNVTSKKLPFLRDILDSLFESNNTKAFDYVIWTNADIGVVPSFYTVVAEKIAQRVTAMATNRRDLPKGERDVLYTGNDLDKLYTLKGKSHPGIDCLVFRASMYYENDFTLGDVFLGYPPVGNLISTMVESRDASYKMFESFELGITFHLGADRKWFSEKSLENKMLMELNCKEAAKKSIEWKDKVLLNIKKNRKKKSELRHFL